MIGTTGEYLRMITEGRQDEVGQFLSQSIDNFLDPVEHTWGFWHSVATLGVLKGVNALIRPVYMGLTDLQQRQYTLIEKNIGKIDTNLNKAKDLQ